MAIVVNGDALNQADVDNAFEQIEEVCDLGRSSLQQACYSSSPGALHLII